MKSSVWNEEDKDRVIGIMGGFGSYATLNFFEQILDSFPAEKEWERPRILIDNYCTLPSRVRCILYGEHEPEIIEGMSSSISNLINAGAKKIIITCNTAHYFLDDVYRNVPESKDIIINIIEELAIKLHEDNVDEVSLIASEGTLMSKLYQNAFEKYDIKVNAPGEDDFPKLREFIEVVKQNKPINSDVKKDFIDLINEQKDGTVILGCTEFPVIYKYVKEEIKNENITIYDPLDVAILKIKEGFGDL
jgi:aspartate racemase